MWKQCKQWQTLFSWAQKSLQMVTEAMKLKDPLAPWKKIYDKPRQHIKKQRHYFSHKGSYSQSYGFSSSHVWMWELNQKKGWVPKNGCFRTVVLEKTIESLLDCKEIQPVNPKGNQSWIFVGRADAEAEAPKLWSRDEKSRLIREDPDAGKEWRQKENGMTEDEMVGCHHWLNGHEVEQTLGDGEGRGSLACCRVAMYSATMGWQRVGHDWATEQQYYRKYRKPIPSVVQNKTMILPWGWVQ